MCYNSVHNVYMYYNITNNINLKNFTPVIKFEHLNKKCIDTTAYDMMCNTCKHFLMHVLQWVSIIMNVIDIKII